MLLVDAKDDRLLESISGFLQELRYPLGNDLGAFVDYKRTVEILCVVDAVLDHFPVAVDFALLRPVALDIDVNMNFDDLVGRQEAVLDSLLERIRVDGSAEILDVGDVLRLLRGGR